MYKQQTAEGATGCGPAFAKGHQRGHRGLHHFASAAKAPVSIYKTENSYEVMVFAPGRVKENFSVSIQAPELLITYTPSDDTSSLNWIRKEYSRGAFERRFQLDDSIDHENISATYEEGVLKLSLKIIPGSDPIKKDVKVN